MDGWGNYGVVIVRNTARINDNVRGICRWKLISICIKRTCVTRKNMGWLIDFFVFNATFSNISATNVCHGDLFQWWKKPEYTERTTNHGQATGRLYHLRLRVECTLFCYLQSWARTHLVLVIGLYELLGNQTT